jgi:hypothetical protein
MSVWRVILTDSESLTGVAPVCPDVRSGNHDSDDVGVYDCCPGPHIECWSERVADEVSKALTIADAEVCP